MNTTGHSRPLAAWQVVIVTFCTEDVYQCAGAEDAPAFTPACPYRPRTTGLCLSRALTLGGRRGGVCHWDTVNER